jgi:glycosyltransferase involved in cell wall biosynthesis
MKSVVIEGWRRSNHSYALVNQHQLLELRKDARLRLFHVDVPFYRPHWAQIDGGLTGDERRFIEELPGPDGLASDAIYRIGFPMRVHAGSARRVFVFGTVEFGRLMPDQCVGLSGTAADVDWGSVEVVTPSHWSRQGFIDSGVDERRIHVIAHGVSADYCRAGTPEEKRTVRRTIGIAEDAFVFLSIGAMTWNKGIGSLAAAFAAHWRRDPRAILLLKGGDSLYGNRLNGALTEALRLRPGCLDESILQSVRYIGDNLSRADLAMLYRASDVYVSPYRGEGFNLPVLEAMACGVPVIVTRGGSTDDFCPDRLCLRVESQRRASDQGGYFLEPDIDSLIACMQSVAQDASFRQRVAIEGPRWVAERYTWSKVTQSLGDLLAA